MNEFSELGTLVLPKMLEVVIINFADKIDATLEPAHTAIQQAKRGGKINKNYVVIMLFNKSYDKIMKLFR